MPWRNPDASSAVIAENLGWISSGLKWRVGRRSGGGGREEGKKHNNREIPSLCPADILQCRICHSRGRRGEKRGAGAGEAAGRQREGGGAQRPAGPAPLRGLPSPGDGHGCPTPN